MPRTLLIVLIWHTIPSLGWALPGLLDTTSGGQRLWGFPPPDPPIRVKPVEGCSAPCVSSTDLQQVRNWCLQNYACSDKTTDRARSRSTNSAGGCDGVTCHHPAVHRDRLIALCQANLWCKGPVSNGQCAPCPRCPPCAACPRCPEPCKLPERKTLEEIRKKNYNLSYGTWIWELGRKLDLSISHPGEGVEWSMHQLPRGAVFDPITLRLTWTPEPFQGGDHRIIVRLKRGKEVLDHPFIISFRDSWESYTYPGLHLTAWFPNDMDDYGVLVGWSIQWGGYTWVTRRDSFGPSHGRLYLRFDMMESTQADAKSALGGSLGAEFSFERNARRHWLIPYFGLESGLMVGSGKYRRGDCTDDSCATKIGALFTATPFFGVYLWASRRIRVTASAGYMMPAQDFGDMSGWRVWLGANLQLW